METNKCVLPYCRVHGSESSLALPAIISMFITQQHELNAPIYPTARVRDPLATYQDGCYEATRRRARATDPRALIV